QALVYVAEVAAVRYARLWPRAVDLNRPTEADARALALLAREQERIPAARVAFRLAAPGSPPAPDRSPPADNSPGGPGRSAKSDRAVPNRRQTLTRPRSRPPPGLAGPTVRGSVSAQSGRRVLGCAGPLSI